MKGREKAGDEYLYLSAMLAAYGAKLLNKDKAERMLEAADVAEAVKVLESCGFSGIEEDNITRGSIESGLSEYRDGILAEVARLSPDRGLANSFRLKYDCHNIKTLIKSQGAGADPDRLMSRSGSVTPEVMKEAFYSENLRPVPPALGAAMMEAKGILARTNNPQLADICIDRAYFSEMLASADKLGDKYFAEYIRLLIDSANLRTIIRTMRIGRDASFIKGALIAGGAVGVLRLEAALASAESVASAYATTLLENAAKEGVRVVAGGTLTGFELMCDNAVENFTKRAKMYGSGPVAIMVFLAALESEITAARMILVGKFSGVPANVIKERLRGYA